ncbi:MAG: hypothetical protein IKJ04_03800 [Clostridia bacterium]|nr:hypothetical protein [Clostridia bacterium]MBR4033909.1 hypothetical protein [Clostridia bacterium]
MFSNVNINSADATISTHWRWNYVRGGVVPRCTYFCCDMPEDVFLKRSLFLENEILACFEEDILRIDGEDSRDDAFRLYNSTHSDSSRLIECQLESGDPIEKDINIAVEPNKKSRIFYVCVYDGHQHKAKVIAPSNHDVLEVKKTKPGFMRPYQMIELPNADGRKKVLKCQYKGFTTYSVLPERCDKYYFDREKDIENIQIQYLSILTNPGGGHGNQG